MLIQANVAQAAAHTHLLTSHPVTNDRLRIVRPAFQSNRQGTSKALMNVSDALCHEIITIGRSAVPLKLR